MSVEFEKQGNIATIRLNRPEKLNAMDGPTYAEVSRLMVEVDRDSDVAVAIVTGTGERAFSAGADLTTMHGGGGGGEGRGPFWQPWRPGRFDSGLECSKPLIAAIHGYCLAGGLELALACDIRIASEQAQFGAPEVKWSILHGYGAVRALEFLSMSHAMLLLLTGDFVDARKAYEWGLVSEVVPPERVMPRAMEIANRIAENGPVAVRMTKELVKRGRDASLADALRLYQEYNRVVHQTEDSREGPRAFAEKRQPRYKGR